MGRAGPLHGRAHRVDRALLVVPLTAVTRPRAGGREVELKSYIVPFTAALLVFAVCFVTLDYAVMRLQGLSLIYQP